jgi:predicted transposase YbfD/YdcC
MVSVWAADNRLTLGQSLVAEKSNEIKAYLAAAVARLDPALASLTTVEKGHGWLETRCYWQRRSIGWFADRAEWPGLRSVGLVEATRETGGKVSVEWRYYLSSLPQDVALFAKAVRGHWAVENQCHWVLDVVFREDLSRARSGHAIANLGILRRLALNLLRKDQSLDRGIHRKQLHAALNPDYLRHLLKI